MYVHVFVLHCVASYPATSCDWRGWRNITFPGLLSGGCHNLLVAQMVVYNCTFSICLFVGLFGTTVQDAECQATHTSCYDTGDVRVFVRLFMCMPVFVLLFVFLCKVLCFFCVLFVFSVKPCAFSVNHIFVVP